MSAEVWKPIPGSDGWYDASSLGRVRSWKRGKWGRAAEPRILQPNQRGPYAQVYFPTLERPRAHENVHRLIALTFLGPPPDDAPLVRHLDDDPSNNTVQNLAYGTKSDNYHDAVRNGLSMWANRTACGKGHAYTPENTVIHGERRRRVCRTCAAASYQKQKARRRLAAAARRAAA